MNATDPEASVCVIVLAIGYCLGALVVLVFA
jgi:hypothetical protein